ncbi:hypothetical protein [Legionella hackeliae]|uniref:Uncharacterized protein n=1 Tax=Legionella hackeliae TaxID=449 RepID=A0A0A8UUC3_LEGHA|nr:hypothetical protein [Legionella hackeliae]KTD11505.1 hypothetical protein Lhac_1901 [Legionella hackeliae]CEK10662.1 exported protein of unknown function [Legionella hackeliae]STX47408.1 Uncharacterised protein [Legionella hackeliae]
MSKDNNAKVHVSTKEERSLSSMMDMGNISLIILGGFMATLGLAAVAVAFTEILDEPINVPNGEVVFQ